MLELGVVVMMTLVRVEVVAAVVLLLWFVGASRVPVQPLMLIENLDLHCNRHLVCRTSMAMMTIAVTRSYLTYARAWELN